MSIKLRNTTASEIIVQKTLFREAGTGDETQEIPNLDQPKWAEDDDVIGYINDGSLVLSYFDVDKTSVNEAINILKNTGARLVSVAQADWDTGGLTSTPRYAPSGFFQQFFEIEFTSSEGSSVHEKDHTNTDIGWSSLKFYKDDGSGGETECTDQADRDANCIRTDLLWEPDEDYVIKSGSVRHHTNPNTNVYVWVLAVDLDAAYGGPQVTFADGGINFKYAEDKTPITLNGVSGTHLYPDKVFAGDDSDGNPTFTTVPAGVGANRLRFVFRHPAGQKTDYLCTLEIFRASS